jgi:protein tyrosine/serine phosphatase
VLAGVLAAVVGVSAWGYFGWVRPNVVPENFGVVEAGKLYRAAALTPGATKRVHDEHGIKTIVDLGGYDKDPTGERIAQRTAEALGIERYVFELEGDGTGNPNAYVAALRVITDPSKQPVLVHCSAGAQRTSGCVMLYKDVVLGQPLDASYPEAAEYRHDPARNPRLLPFVKEHEREIVEAYKAGTQIEAYPKLELRPRSGK